MCQLTKSNEFESLNLLLSSNLLPINNSGGSSCASHIPAALPCQRTVERREGSERVAVARVAREDIVQASHAEGTEEGGGERSTRVVASAAVSVMVPMTVYF